MFILATGKYVGAAVEARIDDTYYATFSNLGLIVIDEEHETTYKSEQIPRYHARETAIARAKFEGASVVLGSATPSLEAFYRAERGEYEDFLTRLPAMEAMYDACGYEHRKR